MKPSMDGAGDGGVGCSMPKVVCGRTLLGRRDGSSGWRGRVELRSGFEEDGRRQGIFR